MYVIVPYKIVPVISDSDEVVYDHWKLVEMEPHYYDRVEYAYLYFDCVTVDGVSKRLTYSTYSRMIFGIEECDATIDDLEIIINFVNRKWFKTDEFQRNFINHVTECILYPEYFDLNETE